MKKAFSYIRMSTKSQLSGDSKRRQLERSMEYAKDKGYEFIKTIEDIGISAYSGENLENGELGRFLFALQNGDIDPNEIVLLVESLDRLSRKTFSDAFEELNKFLKTGITIVTTIDKQEYTKDSIGLAHNIYTVVGVLLRAHEESETKSKRLKEAWKKKREDISRRKLTSICPAWLKLSSDKSRYEKVEENVTTIRKIFDMCIDEGMGTYASARYLNENISEYPRFTKPRIRNRLKNGKYRTGWQKSYITKILNNPAVHGEFQPCKKVDGKYFPVGNAIEDYFPEVISKDRFNLAQARKRERKIEGSGRRGLTFSNLFMNIAKCRHCGETIIFRDKGKPPKGGKYLCCQNAEQKYQCNSPSWRYDEFEADFFKFINELELGDVLVPEVEKNRLTKLREDLEVQRHRLSEKNKEYKRSSANLLKCQGDAIFADLRLITKQMHEEISTLKASIRRAKVEIASLESKLSKKSHEEIVETINRLSESLADEKIKKLRRRLHSNIRSVVEKIEISSGPFQFFPYEVLDAIPIQLKKELIEEKGLSEGKAVDYLMTEHGQRVINKTQRSFTVYFKNGARKSVYPYKDFVRKTHPKMLEWMLKPKPVLNPDPALNLELVLNRKSEEKKVT